MYEDVKRFLVKKMGEREVPGFSASIVKDDRIVWSEGFGFADKQNKVEATPDTVYRVASVSKPVIATGLLQLMERGLFRLDDPVNEVLEGVKIRSEHGEPTIRNILTHTSGLPVHVDPTRFSMEKTVPLKQLIRDSAITVRPPDEEIVYSNTAFNIVGYLVGQLSGMPYPEYMEKNLFKPMEMDLSAFEQSEKIRENMAQPYARKKGGPIEAVDPWYGGSHPEKPCGSLFSTVNDLSHFLIAHMNQGTYKGKIMLQASTLEEMHRLQAAAGASNSGYGLTWKRTVHYGRPMLSHTGGNLGWTAHVCFYPDLKLGIAILCNLNDNTGWRPPAREALYIASGGSLDFDPSTISREKTPPRWGELAREYVKGFQKATVYIEDGVLVLEKGNDKAYLEEVDGNVFLVHGGGSDGMELTFELDEAGTVKQFDLETDVYLRYVEDTRHVDAEADLKGRWRGTYVHPYGYFELDLWVKGEGEGEVTDMTGRSVELEELKIKDGQLVGQATFQIPEGYVGWGANTFDTSLYLSYIEGNLEGRMVLKSGIGESATPLTLGRV